MENVIKLDAVERNFKDATAVYEDIQNKQSNVESEIALLLHVKATLEENVSILKSRHVIPNLVEYKRAKDDLGKVHNNLTMMKINKNNLEHALEAAKKNLEACRERYLLTIEVRKSRVLYGNFGKKDDRQDGNSE